MPVGFPDYYGGLTLPVTVEEGGTGQTSLTQYGVLYGEGTSGVGVTLAGAVGDVLQVPSGGGAPVFQALDISLTTLSGILPIANGGTGTSTPGLVAGTNIALSGSWPDQTIALATSVTITGTLEVSTTIAYTDPRFFVANTGTTTDLLRLGNVGAPAAGHPYLAFAIDGGVGFLLFGWNGAANEGSLQVTFPSGVTVNSAISASSLSLSTPLPVASGGTGASSLTAAKIANVVYSADGAASTVGVPPTTMLTAPAAGYYRFSASLYINRASGNSIGVYAATIWTERTHVLGQDAANIAQATSGTPNDSGDVYMYCDSGTAIKYEVTTQGTFGVGDSLDYDVTLEQLG